jgi:translation initiation factor 3 subunit D
MKLGYVSRSVPTSNSDHVILSSQLFKPKDFAAQINLSLNNMWGILKMISELLMKDDKPDGKYVLMKDPNKASVRLYSVPPNTFEEGDVDDEDEEIEVGVEADED